MLHLHSWPKPRPIRAAALLATLFAAACGVGDDTRTSPSVATTVSPTGAAGPGWQAPFDRRAETSEVGTLPGAVVVDGGGNSAYQIALTVPPGPHAAQPHLAVSYNSGSGSGLLGVGFSLQGLGLVSRCPKTLADDGRVEPISFGTGDALCLNGMRLMADEPSRTGLDGAVYRPRVGNRVKVVGHGDIDQLTSWFEVFLPDGSVAEYGRDDNARVVQLRPGSSPATGGGGAVREWWIRTERDAFGNEVRFSYDFEVVQPCGQACTLDKLIGFGVSGDGVTRQDFRPVRIEYGFTGGVATRSAAFEYANGDLTAAWSRGAFIRQQHLLTAVVTYGPDGPVTRYELEYAAPDAESITKRALLTRIRECTAEAPPHRRCKPDTVFKWESGVAGFSVDEDEWDPNGTPNYDTYLAMTADRLLTATPPAMGDELGTITGVPNWMYSGVDTGISVGKVFATPRMISIKKNPASVRKNHIYQDAANTPPFVVQGNNDEFTDVVEVQRWSNDIQTATYGNWGLFLGGRARLLRRTESTFDVVALDLGPDLEPIMQFVPLDIDGNGITDYVYCRADSMPADPSNEELDGYLNVGTHPVYRLPRGHWYTAMTNPDGTIASVKKATDLLGDPICHANDQLLVVDADGDGKQDLLVVNSLFQPHESESIAAGARKRPSQWGNYRRLRLSPEGWYQGWTDTNLPADRFQRFMMGAFADSEPGSDWSFFDAPFYDKWSFMGLNPVDLDANDTTRVPFRSGGLGWDKVADVNGDGLPDIIRLELCVTDLLDDGCGHDIALQHIRDAADPRDPHPSANAGSKLLVTVWENMGNDAFSDPRRFSDSWFDLAPNGQDGYQVGNLSAPGMILRFVSAYLASAIVDLDADGRADMISPEVDLLTKEREGTYGNVTYHYFTVTSESSTWVPHFYAKIAGPEWASIDLFSVIYDSDKVSSGYRGAPTMDVNRDGLQDPVVLVTRVDPQGNAANVDFEAIRHLGRLPDRVVGVRNGMGVDTEVNYLPLFALSTLDPDAATLPYPVSRANSGTRPAVQQVRTETGVTGTKSHRTLTYEYGASRVDRLGRGFLGFTGLRTTETYPTEGYHTTITTRVQDPHWEAALADYPNRGAVLWRVSRSNFAGTLDGETLGESALAVLEAETSQYIPHGVGTHRYTPYLQHESRLVYMFDAPAGSPCAEGERCDYSDLMGLTLTPVDGSIRTVAEVDGEYGYPISEVNWDDGRLVSVDRTYENRTSPWQLGLVRSERVTDTLPNHAPAQRYTEFEYTPFEGALWVVHREPGGGPDVYLKTMYQYDSRGNPVWISEQDLQGDLRGGFFGWDGDGVFLSNRTNLLGHTTELHWARGLGVLEAVVDANGLATARQLDGFGREVVRQALANGVPAGPRLTTLRSLQTSQDEVDPWTVTVLRSAETGEVESTVQDPFGRPLSAKVLMPGGEWSQRLMEYGRFGEVLRETLPFEGQAPVAWKSYTYDQLLRQRRALSPNGEVEETRYGARTLWSQDARGTWRRAVSDDFGHVVRTLDGLSAPNESPGVGEDPSELCLEYGPFDRLDQTRPCPASAIGGLSGGVATPAPTTLTYDVLGRRVGTVDERLGTLSFDFNAFGEVRAFTNGRGQQTTYQHDGLGRVTRRDSAEGVARWTWDTSRYGALSQSESESGAMTGFQYDAAGRVTQRQHLVQGEQFTFSFGYDEFGRLASLNYPTAATQPPMRVQYDYWPSGHLRSVQDANAVMYWESNDLDPWLRTEHETFRNGVQTEREFDPLSGRLTRIHTSGLGNPEIQDDQYVWDAHLLWQRVDQAQGNYETFAYDRKDRLLHSQAGHGGLAPLLMDVSYDPWGNILTKSDVGAYGYDHQKLLFAGPFSFGYDASGNMTSRSRPGFTGDWSYTSFGKPSQILGSNGDDIRFEYDAEYNRVRRTSLLEGSTTITLESFQRETVGTDVTYTYTVQGEGRAVVQVRREEHQGVLGPDLVRYIHDDHLGSTAVVTGDLQGNGVPVLERMSFGAWGAARDAVDWTQPAAGQSPLGLTLGFTGHMEKLDAQLINMGGRMYDPEIARFAQPDPFVQAPSSMASHNRYSYVWNSPLSFTDPSGYLAIYGYSDTGGGGGGGGVGAVGGLITGLIQWLAQGGAEWIADAVAAGAQGGGSTRGAPGDAATPTQAPPPGTARIPLQGGGYSLQQVDSSAQATPVADNNDLEPGELPWNAGDYQTERERDAAREYRDKEASLFSVIRKAPGLSVLGAPESIANIDAAIANASSDMERLELVAEALGPGGGGGRGGGRGSRHQSPPPNSPIPNVKTVISQKQNRHIHNTREWQQRGQGGYFKTADDAQRVLDAIHDGRATILHTRGDGNVIVRYNGVTGYHNNHSHGVVDQPTNTFMLKGTQSPSLVPVKPTWP